MDVRQFEFINAVFRTTSCLGSPPYIMSELVIVAIGGPSSSGKSTCANALHCLFSNSILVHLDDFYLPDSSIPIDPELQVQNWDGPEAIDFDKFFNYVSQLKHGGPLHADVQSLEMDPQLKLTANEISHLQEQCRSIGQNKKMVFIDGFMLFHDERLITLFDKKLFFYGNYDTLKSRRENRLGYNTAEGFWVDPPNYFEQIVWPEYQKTHLYLFENDDVNSSLNNTANKLGINGIRNDGQVALKSLIETALTYLD